MLLFSGVHASQATMTQTGEILIVTGPPGAGKTTTAAILARAAQPLSVHLISDDFFDRYICTGYVLPWLPEAAAQNVTVMRAVIAASRAYADGGFRVIVDGIVGPWFLEPWRQAASKGSVRIHYVVLRAHADRCVGRVKARATHGLKASGPVRELNRQFADLGALEGHAMATDDLDPQAAATGIRERLAAGCLRL